MAIPLNRMIDWTLLANKPDDVDRVNPVYDIDGDEQKCQLYGVFKTFFVKTDEPTDVEATVEFQSTSTKPNSILKFGSAGEFHVYSDGTDLFMKGTTAAGKLRFYANSIEMFALNPTNSSIETLGMAINKNGAAGVGINFDDSNRPVLLSVLQCDAGIALKAKNISFSGLINTGLVFNTASEATFKQLLTGAGGIAITKTGADALDVTGESNFRNHIRVLFAKNIDLGSGFINEDGTSSKGIKFASNTIGLYGKLRMVGTSKNIELGSGVISWDGFTQGIRLNAGNQAQFDKTIYGLQGINLVTYCDATGGFRVGGLSGQTVVINLATANTLTYTGGILTANT
jgi:hypothetical protein